MKTKGITNQKQSSSDSARLEKGETWQVNYELQQQVGTNATKSVCDTASNSEESRQSIPKPLFNLESPISQPYTSNVIDTDGSYFSTFRKSDHSTSKTMSNLELSNVQPSTSYVADTAVNFATYSKSASELPSLASFKPQPSTSYDIKETNQNLQTQKFSRELEFTQGDESYVSKEEFLLYLNLKPNKKEKNFKCDYCSKCFDHKEYLDVHKCESKYGTCNMSLSSNEVESHMKKHNVVKEAKCVTSKLTFKTKRELAEHKLTHTRNEQYDCNLCKKILGKKSNKNKRKVIHTVEKPHKYDICQREFAEQCCLLNHQSVHSEQKRYRCIIPLCQRSFGVKESLVEHMLIHASGNYTSVTYIDNIFDPDST